MMLLKQGGDWMKKPTMMLLSMSLCASIILPSNLTFDSVSASTSYTTPVSVRLSYSSFQKASYSFTTTGNYLYNKNGKATTLKAGTYTIKNSEGNIQLIQGSSILHQETDSITFYPEKYDKQHYTTLGSYKFLGDMTFRANGSNVLPVNTLEQEDYLLGVVPYEMSDSWPLEALKAQAVTARTYSSEDLGKEIDNTTSYQVYNGYNPSYSRSEEAVTSTAGQRILYKENNIGKNAFFYSSNGGTTLSKVNSWGTASWNYVDYLQRVSDPYDAKSSSTNTNWSFSIKKTQIDTSKLNLASPQSWWNTTTEVNSSMATPLKSFMKRYDSSLSNYDLKIVSISELDFTNHSDVISNTTPLNGTLKIDYMAYDNVNKRYVTDSQGNIAISRFSLIDKRTYDFYLYNAFGSNVIKSPNIKSVTFDGTSYVVTGGGWGHGIGMSQWGANQRAKEGQTYEQILSFYFPGTTLSEKITDVPPSTDVTPKPEEPDTNLPETPTTPGTPTVPEQPTTPEEVKNPVYFKVANEKVPVYDNRSGSLEEVGYLVKGQVFKIVKDYGANWWQIKWGDHYGYVRKYKVTPLAAGKYYENENKDKKNSNMVIQAKTNASIVDNTGGSLVDFAVLLKGRSLPVLYTMGNWYAVDINGRIGFIYKSGVTVKTGAGSNSTTTPNTSTTVTTNTYHTVAKGDTLFGISRKYGVSVDQIVKWNKMSSQTIKIGQKLIVGTKTTVSNNTTNNNTSTGNTSTGNTSTSTKVKYHTVVKGDTLYSISRKYNVSVSNLQSWNNLGKSTSISVGKKLIVSK